MRSVFTRLILTSFLLMTACASNQKQNEIAKSSWQKVQVAIENRDDQAAQKALSEIGPYTTVQKDNGDFAYFDTSGLAGNVSRIINTLKQCDWALKSNVRREINKCTTPTDEAGNHLSTWLGEYSGQYSKTIPIDAKKLTAKFDEAEKSFRERELADATQRKQRAEQDRLEYEKSTAESQAKELAKEKDPKTWSERACNSQKLIDLSNDTIRREKAGAKHSGVVNQRALYGAGQTIETMQEQQSKQKSEYKKLSGKDWSPAFCN